MNRSFSAPIMKKKEKEEEQQLGLFLEMRKREKERSELLFLNNSDEQLLHHPLGSSSPLYKIGSTRKSATDEFLNSDADKNDYDWLLTPPGTPLFPSLEESQRSPVGHIGTTKGHPTMLKSRLANPPDSSRTALASRHLSSSTGLNSSGLANRRPSSSGGSSFTSSRPTTPTGRPGLPVSMKPSRSSTPTSRPTVSTRSGAPPPRSTTPSRSSAVTSRPSAPVSSIPARSVASQPRSLTASQPRSSTPSRSSALTSRPSAPAPSIPTRSAAPPPRSSTPSRSSALSSRPSAPAASRPASRSSTPTRRPSTPSTLPASSGPPSRSSSVTKRGPTASKNSATISAPPHGNSPTVKPRPWNPSDIPGFSHDAPPNLRTSLPERPSSASRGRPGAPTSRSSSVEAGPSIRPRRQSCSPSRGRTPNGNVHSGSSVPAVSRSRTTSGDSVSPVVIGSKMVERVVNVRRLVPPKQDDQRSNHSSIAGKSSLSPDSTGFGRTLSKKSLDMAMRHMDIRRSIPNNLRPLMTNIPASSMYSVRSGPTRSRAVSVSDSPLATSSNASSEQSVNNIFLCFDGSDIGDNDLGSDRGGRTSPAGGPLPR